MTWVKTYTLCCDSSECGNVFTYPDRVLAGGVEPASDMRVLIQAEGWVHLPSGNDYCPEHAR